MSTLTLKRLSRVCNRLTEVLLLLRCPFLADRNLVCQEIPTLVHHVYVLLIFRGLHVVPWSLGCPRSPVESNTLGILLKDHVRRTPKTDFTVLPTPQYLPLSPSLRLTSLTSS